MSKETHIDDRLIEQYLQGTLPDTDLQAFETRLATEPELQKQLEAAKYVHYLVKLEGRRILKERLRSIDAEQAPAGLQTSQSYRRWWMGMAAAILLLAIPLGIFLLKPASSLSPAELYSENWSPYRDLLTDKGTPAPEAAAINEAMAHYKRRDYKAALASFEKILLENPGKADIRFYAGVAYQGQGDDAKALDAFDAVIREGDNLFVAAAEWYRALSLLRSGDLEGAKAGFREVVASGSSFGDEAAELLEELD